MEQGISKDVYSEVYSILNFLGYSYISRIPKSLYEMIIERKNNDYYPQYHSISELNQKNIKKETISLLCVLQKKYWNYGVSIDSIIKSNEKIIKEKYNPDNLFKKKIEKDYIEEKNSYLPIEVKKQNIFERFINFIKRMFK